MVAVAWHYVCRSSNNWDAKIRLLTTNFFRCGKPVHHWHLDVHENGEKLSRNERRYCLGPIGREFDTIAKEKEQFPKMTVIVPPIR